MSTLTFTAEETIALNGQVEVNDTHLQEYMAENGIEELTIADLRAYLDDQGIEVHYKNAETTNMTWTDLLAEGATTIPLHQG